MIITVLAPAAAASASPAVDAAQRLHEDGQRVEYHAKQTVIAERDLVTARFYVDQARVMYDNAVSRHAMNDAKKWADRYEAAKADERGVRARLHDARSARDQARADFRDSARAVRRIARAEQRDADRG